MTIKLKARIAACLLAGAVAWPIPSHAEEYEVLILQSFTGALGFVGVPIRQGMLQAVDDVNAKHLLGPGNTLKAIVEDDGTDRAQALSLINRYAADPKILAILGPTTATVAIPGAQAANDAKITAMVTTNSPEIAKTGPYGFRMSQAADFVIGVIARYTVDKLHAKSCVLIGASDSSAYVEQTQAYQDYIVAHGVKVASRENIKLSDSDFSALATKVVGIGADCVYISATAPVAGNLIIQLRQAGLDPKTNVTGMGSMASPSLLKTGGKAVEGVYVIADWAPGGSSPAGHEFNEEFKKRYGTDADNYGAMGYSAMHTMAEALREAGPNPTRDKVRDALAHLKDVPTILGDGKLSYDPERSPHYGMNVLVVKNGEFSLAP